MRNKFLAGFALIALFGSAFAQDLTLPELNGFKKITKYPVFKPDNLWDFINGAADTYLSYGFIDLHVAEYKKGKNVIKLEVYRHSDFTMAFGIYSTERSPSFRFMNIGTQGYIADGAINFFKGNYYVKVRTFSKNEKILQSAQSLALKVANELEGDSKMPAVLSMFPDIGLKVNEETFINESVLGHKFLNKAFKATYEVGPDNFSIFFMQSSSPEEARKSVNAYLLATGMDSTESESGGYLLKDRYNGTVFLAWKENMIVIISGLSNDQSEIADRYSSEILK
ncbi:MAG: hypothetical protein EPN88_13315 [Bacteroidetes bacterium]|nr:MAG: hypothetical protein EPN88_13315 [Bacteroidota bacterium]